MKVKLKNFTGKDSSLSIILLLIAIIIIFIIFLICKNLSKNKSSKESFDNKNKNETYQFRTAADGYNMSSCTLVNSGIKKDISDRKVINKIQCKPKDDKKGFWICNEFTNHDGNKRSSCGCLYETKYDDPLNLFYNEKMSSEME